MDRSARAVTDPPGVRLGTPERVNLDSEMASPEGVAPAFAAKLANASDIAEASREIFAVAPIETGPDEDAKPEGINPVLVGAVTAPNAVDKPKSDTLALAPKEIVAVSPEEAGV
jgi:hypothetical protein